MYSRKIAILGGGNLGSAIAEGLLNAGYVKPESITVTRRRPELLLKLKDKGINISADNCKAVAEADMVMIVVKPKHIKALLEEIKPSLNKNKHILISLVTGVSLNSIEEQIESEIPVFRAMPNTAIAIRESMTCIAVHRSNKETTDEVVKLFEQLGKAIIIDEELMAAATVLGSCGTAFALRFIRAASQGGIEIGFSSELAQTIASQTVKGAAALILENNTHPEKEIDKVTTPQGITISGLNEMEHQGFSSALIKGLLVSYNKLCSI
jgi:pyrroline-5-carboxylate reductase